MKNDPRRVISDGADILGVDLAPSMVDKMLRHMEMLSLWGRKINLTAVKDPVRAAIVHFLDSLTVFKIIPRGCGLSVLDVGSGPGFPGLVLAAADASLQVTLLDRDPRKIVFLKHVARDLNLQGVEFVNRSVGDVIRKHSGASFDVVVSRAFSSDLSLLDRLHVLLTPDGLLIRMTGPSSLGRDLRLPHFTLRGIWEGTLPFSSDFRRVISYRGEPRPLPRHD